MRTDARATLAREALDKPLEILGDLASRRENGRLEVTKTTELQYQLFVASDPLPILQDYAKAGYQLYRVCAHMRLYARLRTLSILEELAAGTPPTELKIGPNRKSSTLISGMWSVAPASLICFPLLARFQPLAIVVKTSTGAELVILPPPDNSYSRVAQMVSWPVGSVGASLFGEGRGIYRNLVKPWEGTHTSAIFEHCVQGANNMLAWLTDPARWRTTSGGFDVTEHWIAWTSVLKAVQALMNLAENWATAEAFWTALRALSILQGIWEGSKTGSVQLRDMLRPEYLKAYAAPHIADEALGLWTLGVIDKWEEEIQKGFQRRDMDSALESLEELRNLVHGVGAPNPHRGKRLKALRLVEENRPNLQLLPDVTVMWWTAALFAPSSVCRFGRPPWVS